MRNSFIVIMLLLLSASCSHTYYVVRHAEKQQPSQGVVMNTPNDPPLSEAGTQRAERLKEILKHDKIRAIYSTNTTRTLTTAKPIADLVGITTVVYDLKKDTGFIPMLKGLKKNVLIVGHSNTVDDIVNALAGEQKVRGDLPDSAYSNLYRVKYKGKKVWFKNLYF